MSPGRFYAGLFVVAMAAVLLLNPGCDWWVWSGSDSADDTPGDATTDGDSTTSGADGSTDGLGDGADGGGDSPGGTTEDVPCTTDTECDDGMFCTGTESCVDGFCAAGTSPCTADETCDEEAGECVAATCTTDADCSTGQTCQDGVCTSDDVGSDGLAGLAVDAESGDTIDFDTPLSVGDTLTLVAPSPPVATVRQPSDDCTCAWTVDPATAGVFSAPSDCVTDFTVSEAGAFAISVDVTCADEPTTYRQSASAEEVETEATCSTDDDCDTGETCQDGACAAAPTEPTVTLLELETRTPYVVRFYLFLEDADGDAVTEGVAAEHFRVYENGVRVDVTETSMFVNSVPDLPLNLVLVLDYSSSMASVDAIAPMILAAGQFVQGDYFSGTHSIGVVESHDRTGEGDGFSTVVDLTRADQTGKDAIVRGLPAEDALEPGMSRIWDAVALAIEMLAEEERQPGEVRAVVFLTDGRDTTSTETPTTLTAAALDAEVNLYPIGFGNVADSEATLRALADDTAGGYFPAANGGALTSTFSDIANELLGKWSLTYITPQNSGAVTGPRRFRLGRRDRQRRGELRCRRAGGRHLRRCHRDHRPFLRRNPGSHDVHPGSRLHAPQRQQLPLPVLARHGHPQSAGRRRADVRERRVVGQSAG